MLVAAPAHVNHTGRELGTARDTCENTLTRATLPAGFILAYWKKLGFAALSCFSLVVISAALSPTAEQPGIQFTHFKGNKGISINLEEFGPGVCVADFDGDGWPDIYFVNGRDLYGRGIKTQNALYYNNGDGTFTDVTGSAGVPGTAYGLGCVWGDYDNDGFPDLYVTQFGKNVLYHNNG